jgi:hypothetical protein
MCECITNGSLEQLSATDPSAKRAQSAHLAWGPRVSQVDASPPSAAQIGLHLFAAVDRVEP